MRVRPESQVRLPLPILQIVPRLKPRPRKIRNLIPLDPHARQPLHRRLIEISDSIFPRHIPRPIPRSQHQQLAPQPAVLIHLQHVNRNMRNAQPLHPIERLLPTSLRLPRQPSNQIDADRFNPRRPQQPNLLLDNLRRVLSSRPRQLLLHKRLHAQTHPIDPRLAPRSNLLRVEPPRSRLDSSLRPLPPRNRRENRPQRLRAPIG